MSSNSIALRADPRSGPPNQAGFVTQGNVDWVGFGNTVLSASIGILHRLSGAGVQSTTHCGGLALSSQYHIGEVGRQRIEEALQRLPGIALYDHALFVGFGTQSLVRILEETESGIKLIALCTCLTDNHSEAMASGVMGGLRDWLDFPLEYKPSYSQFGRLLKACAGVSSVTTFGSTVDVMLRSFDCDVDSRHKPSPLRRASAPQDIANVLRALFRISRGELESINVVAGVEGAFIAAISCWLFDFRTETRTSGGEVAFTNFQQGETSQVSVQFANASNEAGGVAQISSTTYILHDCEDLLGLDHRAANFVVRTPWSNCLERTFGSTFTTCLGLTRQLGTYLGSLARIYSALARCEPGVSQWQCENYVGYSPSTHGLGFVDSVLGILPELSISQQLGSFMREAAEAPFDEAVRGLQVSLKDLRRFCGCELCTRSLAKTAPLPTYACCVAMALTIRDIIVTVSSAIVIGDLLPTLSGLEKIHSSNAMAWSRTVAQSSDWSSIGLESREWSISGGWDIDIDADAVFTSQLTSALETLFLGTGSLQTRDQLAFSRSGICIFSPALQGISSKAELMRRVTLVPGHIQYINRCYDEILDIQGALPELEEVGHHLSESAVEEAIQLDGKIKLEALVVEPFSGENLHFGYRATLPGGGVVPIQPSKLVRMVLRRSGLICCDHQLDEERKDSLPIPCSIVERGWYFSSAVYESLPRCFNISCCLSTHADDVARCVALSMFSLRDTFIRDHHSCLPCSVNAALSSGAAKDKRRKHIVLQVI